MNILAIDQGTTSSRAMLFDESGKVLSSASYPITQYYPFPGWVEHDANEIVESVYRSIADCLYGFDGKIDCIGITNQRETSVLWDRKSGKPLCKAVVWQCRRTADICEKMKKDGLSEYVKKSTGLPIDAYFSATKIKWMLDEYPEIQKSAKCGDVCFGTVDSYLVYRLTGNHLTDYSNASRTMLFNINTLKWDEKLCGYLGIPMCILPEVCDSLGDFGSVKKDGDIPSKIWNVRITSVLGDQQAALFGQTCFEVGSVKNTYGTGCFTLMNIGDKPILKDDLITTIAWGVSGKTEYALEGSVFNAGSSVQWLRDTLGIIKDAPEASELAQSIESNGGVYFVSAFTGLGAPYWDMYARGALIGLTRGSGRAEICRAVLEGIAFQVHDLVRVMESAAGCKLTRLYVDGGASASDFLMQFQADILGITVDRPQNTESTAFGAALSAGVGCGLFVKEKLSTIRQNGRTFSQKITEEEKIRLLDGWENALNRVLLK